MSNDEYEKNNENQRLKKELLEAKAQISFLKSALDNLPNPIFIKDGNARFLFFNKKYQEAFGMKREDFIGRSVLDLGYLKEADRLRYHKEDLGIIENSSVLNYEVDFTFSDDKIHPSLYWSKGFVVEEDSCRGLVGEIVDISKERSLNLALKENIERLEKANKVIEQASHIDPGTGLYNRYVLGEKLNELVHKAVEERQSVCVIMADLDHFKRVNDRFGHIEGDKILKGFANIILGNCRPTDMPVRFGGEEFLVLLNNINIEGAKRVAERLRQITEKNLLLPNNEVVTVSIGVTKFCLTEDPRECLARVDDALYKAKNSGRNRVVVSPPPLSKFD